MVAEAVTEIEATSTVGVEMLQTSVEEMQQTAGKNISGMMHGCFVCSDVIWL